jgi:hypothetical protein
MKNTHVHVHVGTKDGDREDSSNITSLKGDLVRLASKISALGSTTSNPQLKKACKGAEQKVDEARSFLHDAQ